MYIYHGTPENIEGDRLMPLNSMKIAYPQLYEKYVQKYDGREEIMRRTVPLLDCLWNDVIQFTPVHPKKVFELQKQLGLIEEAPHYKFFEIDLSLLDPDKTVVYFKDAAGEENVTVKWLGDVDQASLQEIPRATIDYYNSLVGTGELPFNYQFVPHILYMGNVKIAGLPVVTI